MATSGEDQRPPAGNFNGRLRGESHGRRQTGRPLSTAGLWLSAHVDFRPA